MNTLETVTKQGDTAELVIIGAGGAGLATALSASEHGLKDIVILEKMDAVGGNTNMSSGMFATESPAQRRQAIDARSDTFFKILSEFSHWKVNPRLVRSFIDKSGETIRWLESMGIHFICQPMYPNQIPTWHQASRNRGAEMIQVMTKACRDAGVDIQTRTSARKILIGEDGSVKGVIAERQEENFTIRTKNLVIASGGFGGNKNLLKKYCPDYHDSMLCDGMLHTGDGLTMALEAGAATEGLGVMLMAGPQIPNAVGLHLGEPPDGFFAPLMALCLEPNTLWVNKNGERFADEAISFNHYVSANAVNRQPENLCFTILDQGLVDTMTEKGLIIGLTGTRIQQRTSMPELTRELQKQAIGYMSVQQADRQTCNGCGICIDACPVGAVSLDTLAEDIGELSPCSHACPAGIPTRRYVHLLKQGKMEDAFHMLRQYSPLPAVTGRVCPHMCEIECARNQVDEAVNVHELERYVSDWGKHIKATPVPPTHEERVAVIGSGPAGLSCAYFLTRMGYAVTVFEASAMPGGMLRTGIPEYRLPKAILDEQINYIRDLGVSLRTETAVGKDIPWETIRSDYGAVFCAVGTPLSSRIHLEGDDLEGVLWGLAFLRGANLRKDSGVSGKVVVIGGGNVAVDVALTALRLGAEEVHMACLECGEDIPAYQEELRLAVSEGVTVHEGWGPSKILGNTEVTGIELVLCEAVCDADGNFNPRFDSGNTIILAADNVIFAIGQCPDPSLIHEDLKLTESGFIATDPVTMATNLPGVFAGGDIVSGAATVAQAIGHGKSAAESIHRHLRGLDLRQGRDDPPQKVTNPPETGIPQAPRMEAETASVASRARNFKEIHQGLDPSAAEKEALRCMTCGSRSVIAYGDACRQCRACQAACPIQAIAPVPIKRIEPHVKISDSLEDIAQWIGANPDVLKATLGEYNTFCDQGHDELFAKDRVHMVPLRKPPFYAIRANSDFLDTVGGIKINEKMEVLDSSEKPIPGLYAAGVVAGGWQYDTYCVILSGTASSFAVNSGRIAGETIAKKYPDR